MQVKKHSGELVPFNPDNLTHSLSRSGATKEQVEKVFNSIRPKLYDGIPTKELYQIAFQQLKNQGDAFAARYSLKKALRDLGPEGFYFEKWVSRLFQEDGYQSITSQTVQGHAVTHEIDVVAMRNNELLAIECKFRNDVDAKISVTTPMYFLSRVKDISGLAFSFFNTTMEFSAGWLVTNAYLTTDSVAFGKQYNMNLLSWDYPKESSIKLRVDNNGEYPITCLTTIDNQEKAVLLKNQCILVKDMVRDPKFLDFIDTDETKKKNILQEAQDLINDPIEHV